MGIIREGTFMNLKKIYLAMGLAVCHITAQGERSQFYGRTLKELKYLDSSIEKHVDQTWWDIVAYKSCYYALKGGPSEKRKKRMHRSLEVLESACKRIDACLQDAQEKLKRLRDRSGRGFRGDGVGELVATVVLLPWLLLGEATHAKEIKEREEEITVMEKTREDLKGYIDALNKILAAAQ